MKLEPKPEHEHEHQPKDQQQQPASGGDSLCSMGSSPVFAKMSACETQPDCSCRTCEQKARIMQS